MPKSRKRAQGVQNLRQARLQARLDLIEAGKSTIRAQVQALTKEADECPEILTLALAAQDSTPAKN